MEELIKTRLLQAVQNRVFPGAVVGVVRKNGERVIVPAGTFTYEVESKSVSEDSVFDIASVTKSIPTSCVALNLIEQGQLSLQDKIIQYVPEFQNQYREQATIWHLLTQTLDYGHTHLSAQKDNTPKEILDYILTKELESPPGTKYWYMNATSIVLGLVIERVAGKSLDVLADEMFIKPLGMKDTTFHPENLSKDRIVPTEHDDWRGKLLHGEIHDETAYKLKTEIMPGNAGVFSTVPDLLIFVEMLLNKGAYKGQRYFLEDTVEQMQSNQLESIAASAGLGWELGQKTFMGNSITPHTFGKSGFTGCLVVCDISKGIGIVILSNTVHPKRPANRDAINELRRNVVDSILTSI